MPPEFGRDVDRLLVLELRRELDPDEADATGRGRRARRRGDRAPARDRRRDRRRPRRLRAARLPAAADRADPADRGDAAARRGDAARQDPRAARGRPALEAPARRRRPRARRGARPLGALALLRGAVPLGAGRARRSPACSAATSGAWAASMRAAVLLGDKPAERGEVLESLRAERLGATRVTRCGGRSSRRSCTATARRSSPRSTRRCSACGRGRRPSARRLSRRPLRRHAFGTRRHRHVTPRSLASVHGRDGPGAGAAAADRASSERAQSVGRARRRASCSTSCGRSFPRPRRGRAPRATRAPASLRRNFGRRQKECGRRNRNGARRWVSPASFRVPTYALRACRPLPTRR